MTQHHVGRNSVPPFAHTAHTSHLNLFHPRAAAIVIDIDVLSLLQRLEVCGIVSPCATEEPANNRELFCSQQVLSYRPAPLFSLTVLL